MNRGPRVVAEVLNTAWEITNAQDKLERSKKTRLELLQEAALGNCMAWYDFLLMLEGQMVHLPAPKTH